MGQLRIPEFEIKNFLGEEDFNKIDKNRLREITDSLLLQKQDLKISPT